MQHLSRIGEQHLSLDTPTFVTDGCFKFDFLWIQNEMELSFSNPLPSIIAAEWMKGSYGFFDNFCVSKVDLSGLSSITLIGDHFLSESSSIKDLDVSCLCNLTSIGHFFCAYTSLESLNLSNLEKVTSIGVDFLAGCTSLTAVSVKGLKSKSEMMKRLERKDFENFQLLRT
eukprot:TRINITY_DN2447_c5_g1_i1.p1 TRINITY_DN2447_c5_g1~~TRINITY_DN2447_c5_g1_i1.p1  ORF type:complete len:188 (+),score=27.05 TRINITY_DN2447_c5_g1_i1:53-565(+)